MVCDMGKSCFQAKKDASAIHDLILWSENCRIRKRNPKFLQFCIEMFQALMMNYETKALVYFEPKVDKFKLEKFAPL
jgi:DNA polymerase-3 subunit delta'